MNLATGQHRRLLVFLLLFTLAARDDAFALERAAMEPAGEAATRSLDPAPAPWPAPGEVVFQYAVPAALPDKKPVTAYLWLPPATERVRGLLLGGTVLFEGPFASHPAIRQACARAGLGIVLFSPHLDATFPPAAREPLQAALDALAAASGHPEISTAPWLPYGHSVGTIWTRNILFSQPDRCFGAIFFKGGFGVPEGRSLAEIRDIPLFHVQGRFEEFGPGPNGVLRRNAGEDRRTGALTARRDLGALRASDPRFLIGLAIEDGSTHFALNEPVARLLAEFIVGAATLRIGPDGALRPVSPESGALGTALDPFAETARAAADFRAWSGDATPTFWHVNLSLARAVDAFHARFLGRKPQYLSAADEKGRPLAVGHDMRLRFGAVTWTGPDTFEVRGAFWNTVPDLYPPQADPVTHAEGAVFSRVMAGPLEELGVNRYRVTQDFRLGERPFLLFWHPGDTTHRAAEQPAALRLPTTRQAGKDGAPQEIQFDLPERISASALPLALSATSTSGLPVTLHVDHGPARIRDGGLHLADLPARAPRPLRIRVVASQYGSAVEPRFASAPSVARTLLVDP